MIRKGFLAGVVIVLTLGLCAGTALGASKSKKDLEAELAQLKDENSKLKQQVDDLRLADRPFNQPDRPSGKGTGEERVAGAGGCAQRDQGRITPAQRRADHDCPGIASGPTGKADH